MDFKIPFVAVILFIFLLIPKPGRGEIFTVNSEAEIRSALVEATNNSEDDTIHIAAGTYLLSAGALKYEPGTGTFGSDIHALIIEGESADQTVLDGDNISQIMITKTWSLDHAQEAGAPITIRNLTIQNGSAANQRGGGIDIGTWGASVTIENTVISKNHTGSQGGGMNIESREGIVTIKNCSFEENESDSDGGGLHFRTNNGSLILQDNIFEKNSAASAGGGLVVSSRYGSTRLYRNRFSENSTSSIGGGARILRATYLLRTRPRIPAA